MTRTVNVVTNESMEFSDSVSPEQAVLAAHLRSIKNNNWWSYPRPEDYPGFVTGRWFVACHNWFAPRIREIEISEEYYMGGVPEITNYFDAPGEGLRFRPTGERAYELEAAFGGPQLITTSLLSPYFLGFEGINPAPKKLKITKVDLENRKFWVTIRDEAWRS